LLAFWNYGRRGHAFALLLLVIVLTAWVIAVPVSGNEEKKNEGRRPSADFGPRCAFYRPKS
jgi:hypothetical protein